MAADTVRPRLVTPANLLWLAAYIVFSASVWGGLCAARSWAISSYDTKESQHDWDEWRADAERQGQAAQRGDAPVYRRAPRSARPPTVELLENHFFTTALLAWMLSSVLFATLMFMARGVFRRPG